MADGIYINDQGQTMGWDSQAIADSPGVGDLSARETITFAFELAGGGTLNSVTRTGEADVRVLTDLIGGEGYTEIWNRVNEAQRR